MSRLLKVAALAALLSACAPAQLGAGVNSPVVVASLFRPVDLRPGQSTYVSYKVSPGVLRVGSARLDAVGVGFENVDSAGNVPSTEVAADWIRLTGSRLPQGVRAELVRATLLNETDRTSQSGSQSGSMTTVAYHQWVRVVLRYTLSADATTGRDVGLLTFQSDDLESGVPVVLNVVK